MNVLTSVASGLFTNKDYFEKNLLPMQIYYHSREDFKKTLSLDQRCKLTLIWKDYEKIIGYNKFATIQTTKGSYETFSYEVVNDESIVIDIDNTGKYYDISDFQDTTSFSILKKDVFFGIYKPLSPLCEKKEIHTELYNKSSTIDTVKNIYKTWNKIERLRLAVEALFKQQAVVSHVVKNKLLKF